MNWNGGAFARSRNSFRGARRGTGTIDGTVRRQEFIQNRAGQQNHRYTIGAGRGGLLPDTTFGLGLSQSEQRATVEQKRPCPLIGFVRGFPNGSLLALQLSHQMEIDRVVPLAPAPAVRHPGVNVNRIPSSASAPPASTSSQSRSISHSQAVRDQTRLHQHQDVMMDSQQSGYQPQERPEPGHPGPNPEDFPTDSEYERQHEEEVNLHSSYFSPSPNYSPIGSVHTQHGDTRHSTVSQELDELEEELEQEQQQMVHQVGDDDEFVMNAFSEGSVLQIPQSSDTFFGF